MSEKSKNKYKEKIGKSPGTLLYTGEGSTKETVITLISYNQEKIVSSTCNKLEQLLPMLKPGYTNWIDIDKIQEVPLVEQIGKHYGLDGLVLEDILNVDQLPKLDDHHNYIFFTLKMLSLEKTGQIRQEHVSFVLGNDYLLSFQEKPGDVFNSIRKRIENQYGRHRRKGTDYLLYSLIDVVVDHYFIIVEHLGDRLAELEFKVSGKSDQRLVHSITELKREFIYLRKVLIPLREAIRKLSISENDLIKEENTKYFDDVLDHVNQVIQDLEAQRELLGSVMDLYNSSLTQRMNNVMKTLTVITTVFIPLTFIVGIYGMNFKHMPELEWHYGYPVTLGVMFVIGLCMFIWMKRREWL